MADEKLKISVEVDRGQVKALKQEMNDLRDAVKANELEWKKSNLSTKDAQNNFVRIQSQIGVVAREYDKLNLPMRDVVNANQQLWHAQNRVNEGFKSAASTWMDANRQLRALNQEQRLGNQLLGNLTGILGGPTAGIIGTFQQFEGTLKTGVVALQNMKGIAGSIGTTLGSLATPISIAGAAIFFGMSRAKEATERYRTELQNLWNLQEKFGVLSGTVSPERQIINLENQIKGAELRKVHAERKLEEFEKATGAKGSEATPGLRAEIAKIEAEITQYKIEQYNLQKQINETTSGEYQKSRERDLQISNDILDIKKEEKKVTGEIAGITAKSFAGPSYAFSPESMDPVAAQRQRVGGRGWGPRDPEAQRRRVGGRGFGAGIDQFEAEIRERERIANAGVQDAEEKMSSFEQAAVGSFARVALSAAGQLGQGFTKAFGIGHTLLGQFVAEFLSSMAQLAASSILRRLFSFIPGIGSFLGFASDAAGGGGGGEAPNIGGHTLGREASRPIQLSGGFELKYDRLAFKLRQGERVLDSRSI